MSGHAASALLVIRLGTAAHALLRDYPKSHSKASRTR